MVVKKHKRHTRTHLKCYARENPAKVVGWSSNADYIRVHRFLCPYTFSGFTQVKWGHPSTRVNFTKQMKKIVHWRDEWGSGSAAEVATKLLCGLSGLVKATHSSRLSLPAKSISDQFPLLCHPPMDAEGEGQSGKLCVPWDKDRVEGSYLFPLLSVTPLGYLQMKLPRQRGKDHTFEAVHRLIFCLLIGAPSANLVLCHECENKRCMSINCIFQGKQGEVNCIHGKANIAASPAWNKLRADRVSLAADRKKLTMEVKKKEVEQKEKQVQQLQKQRLGQLQKKKGKKGQMGG